MIYSYNIRDAEDKDIESILSLENKCFLAPWNKDNILYEMHENPVSNFWVIEVNNSVVGFIDYWVTFDSSTIAQIAVDPNYQRNHLGSALIKEVIADAYAKKVSTITLEVRVNNKKAIGLYQKFGFKEILIKPHYYTNGDDASYMIKEVKYYGDNISY